MNHKQCCHTIFFIQEAQNAHTQYGIISKSLGICAKNGTVSSLCPWPPAQNFSTLCAVSGEGREVPCSSSNRHLAQVVVRYPEDPQVKTDLQIPSIPGRRARGPASRRLATKALLSSPRVAVASLGSPLTPSLCAAPAQEQTSPGATSTDPGGGLFLRSRR